MNEWPRCLACTLPSAALALLAGCGATEQPVTTRRPRPVETQLLVKQLPPTAALVTASAAAWKTEELGFEVSGRIEFVAEQNTEIEGRIQNAAGDLIVEGTPIARIESERYELAVANADASVARAEQDLVVGQTELDRTIPAQISAATASVELAKVEYDRSTELRAQNVVSQSELDSAKANYENAFAEVKQLLAAETSQKAKIKSLESAVRQAEQNLRDAKRDLEDCTLYSSFRGKVADTSVVPGSLVTAGGPVVTLQMMDPIMIELEVSGEQSRRLQRTESLPVHVTMPDGQVQVYKGFLHQIDPSADPLTRTFTLTILVLNQQLVSSSAPQIPKTPDIWRLDLGFIPGAKPGELFIETGAILSDDEGAYLWQITNATIESRSPTDHVFEVRKLRVTTDGAKVPYLGGRVFQQVEVNDDQFDPAKNIVIGKLIVDGMPPNQWDGGSVLLDSPSRWMVRPGDLVKVDLSGGEVSAGYFVPMDAIARSAGESFLFIVEPASDGQDVHASIAKRIPITVDDKPRRSTTSALRRIEPIGDVALDGMAYVTKGTHFLIDGEPVSVIAEAEVQR